jgi:pentose-5-phosphate-3-epimerase
MKKHLIQIAPSILAADFSRLGEESRSSRCGSEPRHVRNGLGGSSGSCRHYFGDVRQSGIRRANAAARHLQEIAELNSFRLRGEYAFRIEIDGGVDAKNVAQLVAAGADTLVAGTCIFHVSNRANAVRELAELSRQRSMTK